MIDSVLSHFSITGHNVKMDPVTAAARPKLFEEGQMDTTRANQPADDSHGSWQQPGKGDDDLEMPLRVSMWFRLKRCAFLSPSEQNMSTVGDKSRCVVDAGIASTGRFMVTLHGDTLRQSIGGTEVM